jgi:hypothetical protein
VTARNADAGMVTAEMAVGLPVFALVLTFAVGVVVACAAQLRCADAAAVAARAAARGESASTLSQLIATDAPPGARLVMSTAAGVVVAEVSLRMTLPFVGSTLPITLSDQAMQPLEPGAPPLPVEAVGGPPSG